MHPYNFSGSALVRILLKCCDLVNLKKFLRKRVKRSELRYHHRPFACNITKIKFLFNFSYLLKN